MALRLAERSGLISPSATLAMAEAARKLKAAGHRVLDFALGEPDFATPEHVQHAAIRAMREGKTHYTPAAGIPELREAVAESYGKIRGLSGIAPGQVVISNGAKHALHNALMALCGPGDEVVIPAPYWVSYADLVRLTGASPVIVGTTEAEGFKLSPERLRSALTPRTKVLMLNSPSNPTGAVYAREELDALAEVAIEADLGVISDEIYEDLTYDGAEPTCFASLRPELAERVVTVSGVSKSHAMTGWRIGWSVAPSAVSKFIADLQSQETSNPCSISQYAALAAVTGPRDSVESMRAEFARRREFVLKRVAALPGVTCEPAPGGAFYAFLNVSSHFGRTLGGRLVTNSSEFCVAALESARVALVAGSAFGSEPHARMSFATDLETIELGFENLRDFLQA